MANAFPKEEIVAFEDTMQEFEDQLSLSTQVDVYRGLSDQEAERAENTIRRPQPSIAASYDGTDQTANFKDQTVLSVPVTLGYSRSSPFTLTAAELRDSLAEGRLGRAAIQKLASDVNLAVTRRVLLQATRVIKRSGAATGYDDIALADSSFNEIGVPSMDRHAWIPTRDYNNMAGNLASRATMTGKPTSAYEENYVGKVSGFNTYKGDFGIRLPAAGGGAGITMSTLDAAAQYYVPVARRNAATGEGENVDNRYQQVTWSTTAGVVAGDRFTVATVNDVHHISKADTGQLKPFTVISVDSGTVVTISPPMITNQVITDAGTQYQNCVISTKAANSAIVFLNTVACTPTIFWKKEALVLVPGRYAVPTDAGVSVQRAKTKQGLEVVLQRFYDINTMKTKYRYDILFGVGLVEPEMAGLILFSQT